MSGKRLPRKYRIKYGRLGFIAPFIPPLCTSILVEASLISKATAVGINCLFAGIIMGLAIAAAAPIWLLHEEVIPRRSEPEKARKV